MDKWGSDLAGHLLRNHIKCILELSFSRTESLGHFSMDSHHKGSSNKSLALQNCSDLRLSKPILLGKEALQQGNREKQVFKVGSIPRGTWNCPPQGQGFRSQPRGHAAGYQQSQLVFLFIRSLALLLAHKATLWLSYGFLNVTEREWLRTKAFSLVIHLWLSICRNQWAFCSFILAMGAQSM